MPRRPDDQTILLALAEHGSIPKAAAHIGVQAQTLRLAGFTSNRVTQPHRKNLASNPETRAILDMIDESGWSDASVAKRAGIARFTISRWRQGKHAADSFLVSCIREALEQKNSPGY